MSEQPVEDKLEVAMEEFNKLRAAWLKNHPKLAALDTEILNLEKATESPTFDEDPKKYVEQIIANKAALVSKKEEKTKLSNELYKAFSDKITYPAPKVDYVYPVKVKPPTL